jgi:hypothetical protein
MTRLRWLVPLLVLAPPGFPRGLCVAMNSGPRNFLLFRWEDLQG